MKVQVLSIEPKQKLNVFDVEILVGANIYTFEFKVEVFKLGEHNAQNVSSCQELWDTLQHHPGVITTIYKLVLNVYRGQEVQLPVTITEHLAINPLLAPRMAFAH
ncbi:MAG: hypothetical protein ACPGWR_08585 [Ardenticatenaceae bacterium]